MSSSCGGAADGGGTNAVADIYHERQVRELCALHALNNLFQARGSYTKSELDNICNNLSPNVWINPHRSILGLGNYDINVIMAALQKKGREAVWFDKRKDPGCLDLTNICGFILNVPSEYKLGFVMLPLRRRHWITLRQIHGNFYNLDSKLDSPVLIGRGSDLISYLKEQLHCKDKELFIVVSKEVEEKHSWQHHYALQPDLPFSTNSCNNTNKMNHCKQEEKKDDVINSNDNAIIEEYDNCKQEVILTDR
ncbi:josephin domain containing [Arctopsyche grandis]|uniref:josephin domain containing n=1 Tax=Arctopsyche grandis TaxID=121162 RepID=UPI00406D6D74